MSLLPLFGAGSGFGDALFIGSIAVLFGVVLILLLLCRREKQDETPLLLHRGWLSCFCQKRG